MKEVMTNDLKKFKYFEYNRQIESSNVNKLVRSISKNNLLEENPILVTKDMYVIDGQHRLEACKKLQIPVFYKVCENYKPEDLITFNAAKSIWRAESYANYYANQGNIEYIKLLDFCKKHGISVAVFVDCFFGGKNAQSLKEGDFEFDKYEVFGDWLKKARECQDFIRENCNVVSNNGGRLFVNSGRFLGALIDIFKFGADFESFKSNLILLSHKLKPCTSKSFYIEIFLDIYNHCKRDDKRIKRY